MNNDKPLSDNQLKALTALLSHRTVKQAASIAGITPRTIQRYLTEDNFKQALREGQAMLISDATRRLAGMSDEVLTKLFDLMNSGESDAVKVRAARELLHGFLKFHQTLTIEERLNELEKRLSDDN